MPHDLVDRDEFYESRRESLDDLDDVLESSWDSAQELADEKQISSDFVKGEIDRRGSSEDEVWEAAFDSAVMTKEAAQARHAAAAGGIVDRPATPITKKAAQDRLFDAHLSGAWDAMAGGPKAGEAKPEAAQPQQTDGISAEDRAALAQAPPATRAMIDRHVATHREHYGAVDELGAKWSGTLAERGAATPAAQVQHIDSLLQTEHRLLHGSPEQKIQAMREIAAAYGVGAPSGGPAPQAQPRMQAPPAPAPQQTGNAAQDNLVNQLERDRHAAEMQAWAQAIPEGGQAQKVHQAQQHIMEVASAKKQDGTPAFPYFSHVGKEMYAVIANQMQNGQRPDLVGAYHHAVNMRPDIQEHRAAGLQRDLRAFREQNPVTFDPRVRDRMRIVALGHQRTGTPTNPEAILAEALRREPEAAARYSKQVSQAKQRGHAVAPTLDQSLHAMWPA